MDVTKLRDMAEALQIDATQFFDSAVVETGEDEKVSWSIGGDSPNHFWDQLPASVKELGRQCQNTVIKLVAELSAYVKASSLLNDADEADLAEALKAMRASLKLRQYRSWGMDVLHDEGRVLGVSPPGQSSDQPSSPNLSRDNFLSGLDQISDILNVCDIAPATLSNGLIDQNRGLSQKYRPNTAFIMMPINGTAENEDAFSVYQDCLGKFGIQAIRADQIEHNDVITDRIIQEIKTCEFLFGDLTDERPSVYYEIGYAHSLGRRVALYRKSGTKIHFDLAAYNCPEYRNMTELKNLLTKRLEMITNRSV